MNSYRPHSVSKLTALRLILTRLLPSAGQSYDTLLQDCLYLDHMEHDEILEWLSRVKTCTTSNSLLM